MEQTTLLSHQGVNKENKTTWNVTDHSASIQSEKQKRAWNNTCF